MLKTDVLIIGSEGAGAQAAIAASDSGAEVTIVTKGRLGRSGATITATADLCADSRSIRELLGWAGDPQDTPEAFFQDIVVEGRYLNDQRQVQVLVEEVPARAKELLDWGLKVSDVRQMPGHRYPRSMYTSGQEMVRTLRRQVRRRPIRVIEDIVVTDLLTADSEVVGALGLDLERGETTTIVAKATILATGGAHNLYPFTTGPEGSTGDGQAMALRAGAELLNMEMTQFIPTALIHPPMASGNLFPFLLGPQNALRVWLLNKYGERFMAKWDPERMEHSTRDLLSIGIMTEIMEGRGSPRGGVYFSLAHLPQNLVQDFARWGAKPFLRPNWTAHGLDFKPLMDRVLRGEAIEVAPALHFFMGGVKVDEKGETSLPGLYAAGEVAGGVHGANRLSGNAFAQMVVQGKRAGQHAAQYALRQRAYLEPNLAQLSSLEERMNRPLRGELPLTPYALKRELQKIAAERVGVLREGAPLQEALERIVAMRGDDLLRVGSRSRDLRYNLEWLECLQLENMLTTLEAVARSALAREESRGAHYRRDFPMMDNARWLRNTVVKEINGEIEVTMEPVHITSVQLPRN